MKGKTQIHTEWKFSEPLGLTARYQTALNMCHYRSKRFQREIGRARKREVGGRGGEREETLVERPSDFENRPLRNSCMISLDGILNNWKAAITKACKQTKAACGFLRSRMIFKYLSRVTL